MRVCRWFFRTVRGDKTWIKMFIHLKQLFCNLRSASLALRKLHWHGSPSCQNVLPPWQKIIYNVSRQKYIFQVNPPTHIFSFITCMNFWRQQILNVARSFRNKSGVLRYILVVLFMRNRRRSTFMSFGHRLLKLRV